MEVPVRNLSGETVGSIQVNDGLFAVPLNRAVVHQALLRQQANQRTGTHNTKTRGEVSGGGKKPWPQKGTGRARQGSTRSPLWRHGGTVFGPQPRSYRQRIPRKMRRLALRGLLSSKAAEEKLIVVENLGLQPKTKEMVKTLQSLGVRRTALVVTREPDLHVKLAAGNLSGIKAVATPYLNVVDLLDHDYLVMTVDAVRRAEELWALAPAEAGA
ncbi:MAG: 50S ribosomal protein L4 [Chloroflexi bacterium]|nr:50S ribosomal protein L4 [Chloroflexota bacterium]